MHAADRLGPLVEQGAGTGGHVRPDRQRTRQGIMRQGIFLGGYQVQTGLGGRVALEARPGTQHVEAGAEAGFADHERPCLAPGGETLGQAVALHEDVTGLGAAVVAREIHIAIRAGVGRVADVVGTPFQLGRREGGQRRQGTRNGGHGTRYQIKSWLKIDRNRQGGVTTAIEKAVRRLFTVLSTPGVHKSLAPRCG